MNAEYQLYYWPEIQGRGELIRLAFEEADVAYDDVARRPESEGGGAKAVVRILREAPAPRPFAPPVLVHGDLVIAQSANILAYLGPRIGVAPADERERIHAQQLQQTITDLVAEIHDVHHPIAVSLYYDDQKPESLRRSKHLREERLPKFLSYFEQVLAHGRDYVFGDLVSYVDLSLFQVIAGLDYAFPRTSTRLAATIPKLRALHDRVAARPRIARSLGSPRRIPFNEMGIFRHYDELDA